MRRIPSRRLKFPTLCAVDDDACARHPARPRRRQKGNDVGDLVGRAEPAHRDLAIDERGNAAVKEYDIRTPSASVTAGTLSGGNQQKIVVARELDGDLRLLVLDQPTRGLDVGSIEFIHRQAIRKRDAGTAILLVSAELDEVLEMSDRIAVMYRGELVAERDGRTADKNEIGLLMATGGRPPSEALPPTVTDS